MISIVTHNFEDVYFRSTCNCVIFPQSTEAKQIIDTYLRQIEKVAVSRIIVFAVVLQVTLKPDDRHNVKIL